MKWNTITQESEIDQLIQDSHQQPVAIFKHSTRCPVSMMSKRTVESYWDYSDDQVKPFFLDLIRYRSVSNLISQKTGVDHESPQLIIVDKGVTVHHSSHGEIHPSNLKNLIA